MPAPAAAGGGVLAAVAGERAGRAVATRSQQRAGGSWPCGPRESNTPGAHSVVLADTSGDSGAVAREALRAWFRILRDGKQCRLPAQLAAGPS